MIEPKYMKNLELDKVLAMLAELTCCETAREKALSIQPLTEKMRSSGKSTALLTSFS